MENGRGSCGLPGAPLQSTSARRVADEEDPCFAGRRCIQQCVPSVFAGGPWLAMLQYLGAPPFGAGTHRLPLSISLAMRQELSRLENVSVSQESRGEEGRSVYESVLAVRVARLQQWDLHLEAELADPTGTVCATIGHAILAKLESVLSVGSVLVLRNAPVVPLTNMFPVHFARHYPVGMFRLVLRLEHVEQVFPAETLISVCVPGGVRLCSRSVSASYMPRALVSQGLSRLKRLPDHRGPVNRRKRRGPPGKGPGLGGFYDCAARMKRRRT